jgi:hypothetical protein
MTKGQLMSQTEFDFYKRFKDKRILSSSTIPKRICNSGLFNSLLRANIITKKPKGRGWVYTITNDTSFKEFFHNKYPNSELLVESEVDNQLKYKDTKATAISKERVTLLRGFQEIYVNGESVDLKYHTKHFDLFSVLLRELHVPKICFVENLEVFLHIEKILSKEYVFIHFYGRLPNPTILKKIKTNEVLFAPDYDLVGLHEYIKIKKVFESSVLLIPKNFDELYRKYAKERKANDTYYKNVATSTLKEVVRVREQILTQNKFLEQQILLSNEAQW